MSHSARWIFRCLLLLVIALSPCYAVTNYRISLANPDQHLVEVQIVLPEGAQERQLQLPVWNSLYQIREFSQYVNWIRAKNRAGRPLSILQVDTRRWQIRGAQDGVVVEYQMFLDSLGPFGAQLNPHHAFFNLAQVLMYSVDARASPLTVRFTNVPAAWRVATPMRRLADAFVADNYDRAVDSPVEISNFHEAEFEEASARYHVVVDAAAPDFDMEKITAMLRRIVVAATPWLKDRPFDTYMFF